jgi:hypothetical protein
MKNEAEASVWKQIDNIDQAIKLLQHNREILVMSLKPPDYEAAGKTPGEVRALNPDVGKAARDILDLCLNGKQNYVSAVYELQKHYGRGIFDFREIGRDGPSHQPTCKWVLQVDLLGVTYEFVKFGSNTKKIKTELCESLIYRLIEL